ncbi:hypothetical protein Tco_0947982 [Tanacetum coccineum]
MKARDDKDKLEDEQHKLETSLDVLFGSWCATTKKEEEGGVKASLVTKECNEVLGASFTQGTIPSIPIGGSISLKGFLLPVLLPVVIIVTVVIVAVILVVVVVAIVGVVIVVMIIGVVVVVGGVSFIFKL